MRAEEEVGVDLIQLERRKRPTREIRLVFEKCVVLPGGKKFAGLKFVRIQLGRENIRKNPLETGKIFRRNF